MLRPTPIQRYLTVMRAKGHAAAEVVRGTDLDLAALESSDYLIDVMQYRRVVENMIALTGGEGLGLDIGLQCDVIDFGILGYAALACDSVRQSVEEFWGPFGDALGMMAKLSVPRGDAEALSVDIAASMSRSSYRFFVEEALCLLMKVGAQVSGVEPRFLKLQLSYAAPRYAPRYREIFRCPVEFGARRTRATLARSWFEMPLKTRNPELVLLYKQHLVQLQQQIENGNPLGARLHNLYLRNRGHVPPLEQAARELGLSSRTLKRRLQNQGASYRQVMTAFRTESLLEQLKSGSLTAQRASEQAGYHDVNAFRRAFKRWTGKTLRQYQLQR